MIKPIETHYKGYRFRSRLEARWAVFFDSLGLEWDYELEGFDLGENCRYLPDFFIRTWNKFIEIKPTINSLSSGEMTKPILACQTIGRTFLVVCGSPYPGEYVVGCLVPSNQPGVSLPHRFLFSVNTFAADQKGQEYIIGVNSTLKENIEKVAINDLLPCRLEWAGENGKMYFVVPPFLGPSEVYPGDIEIFSSVGSFDFDSSTRLGKAFIDARSARFEHKISN